MMKRACAIVTLLVFANAAFAAEPESANPRDRMVCLPAGHIDHTSVVSDEAILFYMNDGKIWKNTLVRSCPGLKFENGFAEEIRGGEVCSNAQPITVLRRGTPCFLGAFTPYTKPAADQ